MKKSILTVLILLFTTLMFAKNNNCSDPDPKDYFRTIRVNESPENIEFCLIANSPKFKDVSKNYFVIYNDKINKDGVYLKFYMNDLMKVTKVEYFAFDKSSKNKALILEYVNSRLVPTCETKCDRDNGCYDKPTDAGVWACAAACIISCSED